MAFWMAAAKHNCHTEASRKEIPVLQKLFLPQLYDHHKIAISDFFNGLLAHNHMMNNAKTHEEQDKIIRSYPRHNGPKERRFIIDLLGTKITSSYISFVNQDEGVVEDYPFCGNFHASATEWTGVLKSFLEAQNRLVAVDLGAGWAPWLVAATTAAKHKGNGGVALIAVVASTSHCDLMRTHFEDKGIDPSKHKLLDGVAAEKDGYCSFPELSDASTEWGVRAIGMGNSDCREIASLFRFKLKQWIRRVVLRRTTPQNPVKTRCFSIPALIHEHPYVDLVHIGIQDHELRVVKAELGCLCSKVKRLVIGTHSTSIERNLMKLVQKSNWILEYEENCKYSWRGLRRQQTLDRCQVWRNQNLQPN